MIILDVEASGLAQDSYPIEVAWQHRYNPKLRDGFLIRPAAHWIYWDEYAEHQIHHIPRSDLMAHGVSIEEAANRLNAALTEQAVYSDVPEYDRLWIRKLFRDAQIEMGFQVMSVFDLIHPARIQRFHHYHGQKLITHRAADDVRSIIETLNYVEPSSPGSVTF